MGRNHGSLLVLALVLGSRVAAAGPEPALEFRGNRALTADVIRAGITADQSTLVEPTGEINQEAVERATLMVASVYWDHGYANVRVDEATIDHAHHRIAFSIKEEGSKFSLGSIRFTGDLLRTERAFLAMFSTKAGHVFSRTKIVNDRQRLERFYQDRGYAFVNILALTKIDLATKTVGLTFEITQGALAFIERLTVVGNTRTPTQEILDLISIQPGEPYHGTRLAASERQLRARFRQAIVNVRRGSTPASIEIIFEVDE
jgi:outer membrane protein insertion porin family